MFNQTIDGLNPKWLSVKPEKKKIKKKEFFFFFFKCLSVITYYTM